MLVWSKYCFWPCILFASLLSKVVSAHVSPSKRMRKNGISPTQIPGHPLCLIAKTLLEKRLRYPNDSSLVAAESFSTRTLRSPGGLTLLVSAILVKISTASWVLPLVTNHLGDSGSILHVKKKRARGATETTLIGFHDAINHPIN